MLSYMHHRPPGKRGETTLSYYNFYYRFKELSTTCKPVCFLVGWVGWRRCPYEFPCSAESYATPDNPAYQKFNEKLYEKFIQGDVVGAFQDYLNVYEKANQNLTKKQQNELNKSISGFEDKPNYKDVYPEMNKMAQEYMANGYPPGPAAELAYEKSLNSFLMGKRQDNSASLAMETGGRRPTPSTSGKLPPQFEKAYQQGKAKGLFSDRKEYIENLDPRVRAQYGIE